LCVEIQDVNEWIFNVSKFKFIEDYRRVSCILIQVYF